ncbi:MAG: glutathione S-transferase family protein [Myxococcota bacterium]
MTYQLISFNLCPFVQRSVITMNEKGADYSIEYIDLSDKPDWFLEISPRGKVPLLRLENAVLFESAVINEFLDEVTEPRLHPDDPVTKAVNRAYIELGSTLIAHLFAAQMARDEASARKEAKAARGVLERFAEQHVGPFFNGDSFSLVDAALAPALQRAQWMEEIESCQLFEGVDAIAEWNDRLLARPSVKESTVPEVQAIFVEFLKGRGSPSRNDPPSWLGTRAD